MNNQEFRNRYYGKATDIDGASGVQCVDMFKCYCYDVCGMKAFSLGGDGGYADEIIHRFDALGLGKYFDKVSLNTIAYGDWVVWDKGSKDCPYSHVGMYVGKNGSRIVVFGQNQGSTKANEVPLSIDGVIGVLRVKSQYLTESRWVAYPNAQWKYKKDDGTYAWNEFIWDNEYNAWYFFDTNGYMVRNYFVKDKDKWCYLQEDGKMFKGGKIAFKADNSGYLTKV